MMSNYPPIIGRRLIPDVFMGFVADFTPEGSRRIVVHRVLRVIHTDGRVAVRVTPIACEAYHLKRVAYLPNTHNQRLWRTRLNVQ